MKRKYNEIMDHVNVTEEMQNRILENIHQPVIRRTERQEIDSERNNFLKHISCSLLVKMKSRRFLHGSPHQF